VAKISISLDDVLYDRVRDAAGQEGVSSWLAAAAAARLRTEAILEVTDEIARETGGPFTEQELREAREWLRSSSTPAP
jgi:predicted transcriptional regulator